MLCSTPTSSQIEDIFVTPALILSDTKLTTSWLVITFLDEIKR